MTDLAFREQMLEWSMQHGGQEIVTIRLDPELGPFEAVAGENSQVRMGVLAYHHAYDAMGKNHEDN
jgi:hypothetical protein